MLYFSVLKQILTMRICTRSTKGICTRIKISPIWSTLPVKCLVGVKRILVALHFNNMENSASLDFLSNLFPISSYIECDFLSFCGLTSSSSFTESPFS